MPASDRFFVDTNVVLYSLDAAAPSKQQAARAWIDALWENGAGVLSWQVLQEFYANAIRKTQASKRLARQLTDDFAQWPLPEMTMGMMQRAWYWSDQAQLSFWDSLIVAAAERMNCGWILSEDFQTGRKFGSITIVSPFLNRPDEFGLRRIPR